MSPYSPSCESATSDQTHTPYSTSSDAPVDDGSQHVTIGPEKGLTYMLQRSALSLDLTAPTSNLRPIAYQTASLLPNARAEFHVAD